MIQNSIFTFKRIDEQNGSLHQHESTLFVIEKKTGELGGLDYSGVQNGAHATHPKRISIKFTTNPRTKQKKCCYRHTIYTTKRTHLGLITK